MCKAQGYDGHCCTGEVLGKLVVRFDDPDLDRRVSTELDSHRGSIEAAVDTLYGVPGFIPRICYTDLRKIGAYMIFPEISSGVRNPWWPLILKGGVAGYSLYLHELTELKWYMDHGYNPFDSREQRRFYPRAHTMALLAEHRYIKSLATAEGYSFRLSELLRLNLHLDRELNNLDWRRTRTERGLHLAAMDWGSRRIPPERESQIREFYERQRFTRVNVLSGVHVP